MAEAEELGRGGRLGGRAADELVAAAFAAESAHGPRLARGLSLADLAHAVTLVEGGDLTGEDAGGLLRGLLELSEIPGEEFPWEPALGDAFNSREAELVRRVGPSAAGWLSAGRPRREAFRVALRLTARSGVRELHDALVEQAAALARHARATKTALATDYTYLQPAQPTTVGHLLLAYAFPALRDAGRARRLHEELGASVAGAGGSAGSRWSLDRERLAELLGCEELVEHAKDAAWQVDVYVELLSALAIAATHQSELGQDFEIYASQEFGLVELADAHSRASALMPQKKNPYALAAIRTQAAQAAADLAGALVALHTGSARTDHFHLLNGLVPRALDEAVAVARLTASVLDGMTLRPARFEEIAREGFVTAADVADVLALSGELDYRSAHKVVGRAVRELLEADEPPSSLTPERLAAAAQATLGRPVAIDPATLEAALDPAACAAARTQVGASSEAAMDAMLASLEAALAEHARWSETARGREEAAEAALLGRARELASGDPAPAPGPEGSPPVDWTARAEAAAERHRAAELHEASERQLTRRANAAWAAGLCLLMANRVPEAADWLRRAAVGYRESWDAGAPADAWGRPIAALKALLLAGDDASRAARWALEAGAATAESPIGRYAATLALLVLGDDEKARALAATLRGRTDFPPAVADALAGLAAADGAGYAAAIERVLESFERRSGFLEDVPVADTVLVLQRLAAARDAAVELPRSALLP